MVFNKTIQNTYHKERPDLESLDRVQVQVELKLRKNNDLVTTKRAGMTDDHQGINMTLREQSENDIRERRLSRLNECPPVFCFICADLKGIGNHISVGDLDAFLLMIISDLLLRLKCWLSMVRTGSPEVPLE